MTGLGTNAGLVLTLNGANDLPINQDGGFNFPSTADLLPGASYDVAIKTPPTGKSCSVSAGTGTVANSPITSILVNCTGGTFTVGGTVTGLATGGTLVLTNNGADDLSVTNNNTFAFATPVGPGSSYTVAVKTNPSTPAQTCTVTNGTGTVNAASITNVAVACTTAQFPVNVTVTGLAGGNSVVLQDNGGDSLTVSSNATVPFATKLNSGAAYAVTVSQNPTNPAQTCTVTSGTGTIGSSAASVSVNCSTTQYKVGGSLTGLGAGGTIVLHDTAGAGEDLTLTADGAFAFVASRNSGSGYNATIKTQPAGQTCTIAGNVGTVGTSDVNGIVVNCETGKYTIGGTITGLTGKVSLNDGSETKEFSSNGTFAFSTALANATAYNVVVSTQPTFHITGATVDAVNQTCTVANGSGTLNGATVSNVAVTCVTNTFTLAAQIFGLQDNETITLSDGTETKSTVGAAASPTDTVTFPTKLASGTHYTVTVSGQPGALAADAIAQTCTVTSGSTGFIMDGAVGNVRVDCITNGYPISLTLNNLNGGTVSVTQTGTLVGGVAGTGNSTVGKSSSGTSDLDPSKPLASGTGYTVAVLPGNNPTFSAGTLGAGPTVSGGAAAQTCTVSSGASGTVGKAKPTATIGCTTNAGVIGGAISGLDNGSPAGTNSVTLTLSYQTINGAGQPTGTMVNVDETLAQNTNAPTVPNFTFQNVLLASNTAYTVKVKTQPNDPIQTCTIGGADLVTGVLTGVATGSNAPNTLAISCATNKFFVEGTAAGGGGITGLANSTCDTSLGNCGVQLQLTVAAPNAADSSTQWFNTAGDFQFTKPVTAGATYTVSVATQPKYNSAQAGSRQQTCNVTGGSPGAIPAIGGVQTNVAVSCTTTPRTISGTVTGFEAGSGVTLQLKTPGSTLAGAAIPLAASFSFPTQALSGDTYSVSVVDPGAPGTPQLTCSVTSGGSGTVGNTTDANNGSDPVVITCARTKYTFSPLLQFLAPTTTVGLTVTCTGATNCPGAQTITVNGSDTDSFPAFADLPNNATYTLSVSTPPGSLGFLTQSCQVINPTGTMPTASLTGTSTGDSNTTGFTGPVIRCARGLSCSDIKTKVGAAVLADTSYPIDPDGPSTGIPYKTFCDMTNGGYTLVIRADGTAAASSFNYTNGSWTQNTPFGDPTVTTGAEAKSAGYGTVPVTSIRLVSNGTPVVITLPATATSLQAAIGTGATGTTPTTLATWTNFVNAPAGNLQGNLCTSGVSVTSGGFARVRIGATGNENNSCTNPDSFIGVGGDTGGGACTYPASTAVTTGNRAPTNGGGCAGTPAGTNHGTVVNVFVK